MMLSRRWPRATPGWSEEAALYQVPRSSGPRCDSRSVIRPKRGGLISFERSVQIAPLMPHMKMGKGERLLRQRGVIGDRGLEKWEFQVTILLRILLGHARPPSKKTFGKTPECPKRQHQSPEGGVQFRNTCAIPLYQNETGGLNSEVQTACCFCKRIGPKGCGASLFRFERRFLGF